MMARWWLFVAVASLTLTVMRPRLARALPAPPEARRVEWAWWPTPVVYGVDVDAVNTAAPYVPPRTPQHTGPVVVAPGRSVLVWMRAFSTARVRAIAPPGAGPLRFWRVEPGVGRAVAHVEEPGVSTEPGVWLLRHPVATAAPWLVTSDRPVTVVVEEARPLRGQRIWEIVHDDVLDWIEGDGPMPHIPAGEGTERYRRRRRADRLVAQRVRELPGADPSVDQALVAWRRYRATLELERLRPLSWERALRPLDAPEVVVPHLVDDALPPESRADRSRRFRLSDRPWPLSVRGPGVLRLDVRALIPADGPDSRPLSVVVTTRDDAGRERVVERLDTRATPSRVRDPSAPDAPIPVLVDATTAAGERLSREYGLAIPLRPGRHEYRVEVRGGDVLVRARRGRITSRTHPRDSPQWRDRLRREALAGLGTSRTPAAQVTRALLTDPWSPLPPLSAELERALSFRAVRVGALLRLEARRRTPRSPGTSPPPRSAASRPTAGRPDALDIELAVLRFERWMADGQPQRAVEALRHHARWLGADDLPAFVDAVEDPARTSPLGEVFEGLAVRAPLSARLRAAYVKLWAWTRWVPLRPHIERRPWRWVEPPSSAPAAPDVRDPALDLDALWPVPPGVDVAMVASAHPYERERTPLLRVSLHAREPVAGTVYLHVDGHRYRMPTETGQERFEVAVSPGRHTVRIDAPPGVRALANLPPPAGDPRRDRSSARRAAWPNRVDGRPVTFELDPLPRSTLVQVDLRVVEPSTHLDRPVEAWICFDDGRRHRVSLYPRDDAPGLMPLWEAPDASHRMRAVVPVSRRATRVWVETTDSVPLAVAVKVRRWDPPGPGSPAAASTRPPEPEPPEPEPEPSEPEPSEPEPPEPEPKPSEPKPSEPKPSEPEPEPSEPEPAGAGRWGEPSPAAPDPHARLAEAVRRAAASPRSVGRHVELAHRLLDVGSVSRARRELRHILAVAPLAPSDPDVVAVRELQRRIDAFITDDFVDLPSAATPRLLRPALADLESSDPAWTRVARATDAARDGRPLAAFEDYASAHVSTDALGSGYAAALALADVLRDTPAAVADPSLSPLLPLAYGVLRRVRAEVDTPRLRRLHAQLAAATRWEPLRLAERSAGTTERGQLAATHEPTDAERLHWALLAPPFAPREGALLRSGSRALIELDRREATPVELELYCDDPRAREFAIPVRIRADAPEAGSPDRTLDVPPRISFHTTLPAAASMRVELSLPDEGPEQRCAARWRFEDAGSPPAPERPMQWLRAEPGAPVQMIVLGPTTLELSLQPEPADAAAPATIEIAGLGGEDPRRVAVPAPPRGADPGIVQTLLPITGHGPQRVTVHAEEAPLLVRLSMRRLEATTPLDDEATAAASGRGRPRPRPARRLSLGPGFDRARVYWPDRSGARHVERVGEPVDRDPIRLGSFEAALELSRIDIPEADVVRPRNRIRGTVRWRRELVERHVWLELAGHGQGREDAGTAGGGFATVRAQRGARGLRGRASLGAWAERYAARPAWSLRATLLVDRPLPLTPNLALIPYLRASYRHQSLDDDDVDLDLEPSHAQVFSSYVEDHPLAPTAGGRLRWFPFQDLQLSGDVSITPNSNFLLMDHIDATAGAQGIIETRTPVLIRYGGRYELSMRLDDDDRGQSFLRHGPQVNAGLTYLMPGFGRLNVDIRDTVFIARSFPTRNGLELIVSLDITGGRGVRDISPMQMLFRPLYERRWWRPPEAEARR